MVAGLDGGFTSWKVGGGADSSGAERFRVREGEGRGSDGRVGVLEGLEDGMPGVSWDWVDLREKNDSFFFFSFSGGDVIPVGVGNGQAD